MSAPPVSELLWSEFMSAGWAAEVAAAGALAVMRESGEPEVARWYYARLLEMCRGQRLPEGCEKASARQRFIGRACACLVKLNESLTADQREFLTK